MSLDRPAPGPRRRCAVLIACGLSAVALPALAVAVEAVLQPTPLVLRDGRIAQVSVHSLAFARGSDSLDAAARQGLVALAAEVGTDCFLTAQIIGHVEPQEAEGGDTLAAHRLARARADGVQEALVGRGLPAQAIASVWDWQFLVRMPQVTLWVFRLSQGEDCDGEALVAGVEPPRRPGAEPDMAMAGPPSSPATPPQPPRAAEPAPVAETPVEPELAEPPPEPEPDAEETIAEAEPEVAPDAAEEADAAPDPPPEAAAAEPVPEPTVADAAEPTPDPPAPEEAVTAALSPDGAAVDGDEVMVQITFPVNSSYFPQGAAGHLGALAEAMSRGGSYVVDVVASVAAGEVRGAESATEALAYNRWLAGRRLERVEEWLLSNSADSEVEIRRDFIADDPSRRVVVRLRPPG